MRENQRAGHGESEQRTATSKKRNISTEAMQPAVASPPFQQAHPFDRLRMTLSEAEWVKVPSASRGLLADCFPTEPRPRNLSRRR